MAIKPHYTITDAKRDIDELKALVSGAGLGKPTIDDILIRMNALVDEMDHHNDIAAAILAIGHKIIKTDLKRKRDAE